MKKFISLVLIKTTNTTTQRVSYDETLISIVAQDVSKAKELADEYGKSCVTRYANINNETNEVDFVKVIDVNEYLREETGEVNEIYSRHFDDLEVYSKFEKLFAEE